jgi:hypothetical protein
MGILKKKLVGLIPSMKNILDLVPTTSTLDNRNLVPKP